ncbi:MAG TPA: response regulator [Candidatus Krumholzibacteria bacterium]|nr:response regulator [Candidatus Krumholzibacteria bacterium]HPD70924.1 response regulator [Candidatus Krumholzibacteria bacterium]HRY39376.1 response regulator [Candidatus Krumholzibacteria bacterium]
MVEPAKILVADDDPHIRRILQFLLDQAGYRVATACQGREVLEALARDRPDLVLLDVMMPGLDGFAVLERIRQDRETQRLPVIMLTARDESDARVKGLRGGANDYVAKPFNHEELMVRIANMLETFQIQREANPLTGLPGNLAIEREVQRRLAAGATFGALYLDIDRFKSFNDHYGYARGDRAISLLAHVLCDAVARLGDAGDFVGHVGGDDFVVVCRSDRAEPIARAVVQEFAAGVGDLHDTEDLARGYLETRNRTGDVERSPLISLTVALIVDVRGRYGHPAEMSDALAELKCFGKSRGGSVVVSERRSASGVSELRYLDASSSDSQT